jgi:VWFA-related protein
MAFKPGYILCLLSFCLIGLVGIIPHAAAQSEGQFKVKVDVDLVTVEVSALDKHGDPIPDLKKGDFELYEDGKKQEIVSFDQVQGKTALSPEEMPLLDRGGTQRGKTVLILFVDSAITPRYVKTARDSALQYVKEHMGPQDLFGVGTYVSSMKILQNLTSDRDEVMAAIEKSAESYANVTVYFDDMLRALDQINYSIARLKGQKSVLIYASVGLGGAPILRTAYANTLKSAKASNVVYYSIDPNVEFSGSSPAMFNPIISSSSPSTMNSGAGMRRGGMSSGIVPVTLMSLARDSGGFSIYNTTRLNDELDKLNQQISNYYVLGFQSNNPKHDGAFRKLEVKTNTKGITLKYRSGYQDRRPVDVLASSKQEQKLLTALANPGAAIQLPIVFRPAYFYDSPRSARVLVAARISMAKMAFKKKGGQMSADLNIMGVAYADNGGIAARFSETLPVSFDKDKEQEFRKGSLAYRNYFKLRPGKYLLKLAASDGSNNLGSAEQAFEVPPLPEQGISASSLVIAEQMSRLPDLIQNLQTQLLDENDPLIYSGLQIEPRVVNSLSANAAIAVLFRLYNLPPQTDQWDFVAKAMLRAENGKEIALAPISLKKFMSPTGNGDAAVAIRLPFQNVPPGKYRLIIETSDAASSQTATLQTDLAFTQ